MKNLKSLFPEKVVILNEDGLTIHDLTIEGDVIAFAKAYPAKPDQKFLFDKAVLVIDLEGIISREVMSSDPQEALMEAFPAIRASEIYYEFLALKKNRISIIKEERLHGIFRKQDLDSKSFSEFYFADTLKAASSESAISNEQLSEIALGLFLKKIQAKHNMSVIKNRLNEKLFNSRFFEIGKWSAIVFFLIALTVNFFYHERYRKELAEKRVKAQAFTNVDEELTELKNQIKSSELLLNSNNQESIEILRGINDILLFSQDIRFSEVLYQPLRSVLKQGDEIRLKENILVLKGNTTEQNMLDAFLKFLNRHELIDQVNVGEIREDKRTVFFELNLKLK
jgi:hypothetical protein